MIGLKSGPTFVAAKLGFAIARRGAPVQNPAMPDPAPREDQPVRLPWEFHPALTEERLRFCARLLTNARRDALALAAYELGDDGWSVGCRAYAFGKQRLRRAATSRVHGWLGVLDDSHHFVFLVEGVPVRFYRGFAEEPTVRTLRRQESEAQQLGLTLGIDESEGLVFRLTIETGVGGGVERVVFLALRGEEGHAECAWPVPLDAPAERAATGTQLRLIDIDSREAPLAERKREASGNGPGRRRPSVA